MAKFFLDCEFIEGFHKPLFGKRRHFIDLISIGIVCEDGREYYAISNEFNTHDADQWVKDNVISKLPKKNVNWNPLGGDSPSIVAMASIYKSNEKIAQDILSFVYPGIAKSFSLAKSEFLYRSKEYGWNVEQPVFYGYYADYDWVLFCSLFGRMIDLPKGFPMYCRDLKQMMDEQVAGFTNSDFFTHFHVKEPLLFEEKLNLFKSGPGFPQQENEHSAISDAQWNKKLYEYLNRNKCPVY